MVTLDDVHHLLKILVHRFGNSTANGATEAGKYEETPGRGGDANGVSPGTSRFDKSGQVPGVKKFNRELDDLTKSLQKSGLGGKFKMVGESFVQLANLIKSPISSSRSIVSGILESQADDILSSAKAIAESQTGVYEQLANGIIEQMKTGTINIKDVHRTANELGEFREELHKIIHDDEIEPGDLTPVIQGLKHFKDASGNVINFFEQLPKHMQDNIERLNAEGLSRSKLDKSNKELVEKFNENRGSLSEFSSVLENATNVVANMGSSITNSVNLMHTKLRDHIWQLTKGFATTAGVGLFQVLEDSIFRRQAVLYQSYAKHAISMGMSQREVAQGVLEFRDTLRRASIDIGRDIYSDDMSDEIERIANLGERYNLIGDEAFRFGMQLKETSLLLGQSGNLNEIGRVAFYEDMAKTLNMSVPEFGEFFNQLSKDPGFVGYVNTITATSSNAQDAMEEEFKRRVQMNKILGLTNEQMKERIMLENSKKWQPIVDRHRAKIGVTQLMKMYEDQMGVTFTDFQYETAQMWAFKKEAMTPEQRKEFDEKLYGVLMSLPAQLLEKGNVAAASAKNPVEHQRLANAAALVDHMVSQVFGAMAPEAVNVPVSDMINKTLKQYALDFGVTTGELSQAILSDKKELGGKPLDEVMRAMAGLDEPGVEELKKNSAYWTEFLNMYSETREGVTGLVASGPAKAIGGAALLLGNVAQAMLGTALLLRFTGGSLGMVGKLLEKFMLGSVGTTAAGAVSGAGARTALGGFVTALAGATSKLGFFRLGLHSVLGYFAYKGGSWIGKEMYEAWKSKEWFIKSADFLFSGMENIPETISSYISQYLPKKPKEGSVGEKVITSLDILGRGMEDTASAIFRSYLSGENQAEVVPFRLFRSEVRDQVRPSDIKIDKVNEKLTTQNATLVIDKAIVKMEDDSKVVEPVKYVPRYSPEEMQERLMMNTEELVKLEKARSQKEEEERERQSAGGRIKDALEKSLGRSRSMHTIAGSALSDSLADAKLS